MNAPTSQLKNAPRPTFIERLTAWIGSVPSLIIHTGAFGAAFVLVFAHLASLDTVLLFLTTIVSLEAIYLAIFIQMTVNRHARDLREVSEDVEDIQEDIEEISEDVEEISEDVFEISDDVEEITEGEEKDADRVQKQAATLEQLTQDVKRVLADLEKMKK